MILMHLIGRAEAQSQLQWGAKTGLPAVCDVRNARRPSCMFGQAVLLCGRCDRHNNHQVPNSRGPGDHCWCQRRPVSTRSLREIVVSGAWVEEHDVTGALGKWRGWAAHRAPGTHAKRRDESSLSKLAVPLAQRISLHNRHRCHLCTAASQRCPSANLPALGHAVLDFATGCATPGRSRNGGKACARNEIGKQERI